MRRYGCAFVCIITFLSLSACNSDQSSLESRIQEDLNNVLNNVSQKQILSRKLTTAPPASGMLSDAHVDMYVLVKARAMQLRDARIPGHDKHLLTPTADEIVNKETSNHASEVASPHVRSMLEDEARPVISVNESAALRELNLSQELYVWVTQTIDDTVAFIDSTGNSGIVDIVEHFDPVIKHNITVVQNFMGKLKFANGDPNSRNSKFLHNPDGNQESQSPVKSNRFV